MLFKILYGHGVISRQLSALRCCLNLGWRDAATASLGTSITNKFSYKPRAYFVLPKIKYIEF